MSRGPYHLSTEGMTPEQRERWFRDQGRWTYERRHEAFATGEAQYVNAKFRCSGYTTQSGLRAPFKRYKPREWYAQGTFRGNEWGIA